MKNYEDPKIKLKDALSYFGGKAPMAKFLGLHRVTVTDWVNKDKFTYVPALHAYRLISGLPEIFGKETT